MKPYINPLQIRFGLSDEQLATVFEAVKTIISAPCVRSAWDVEMIGQAVKVELDEYYEELRRWERERDEARFDEQDAAHARKRAA